jgi:hypothetical protein
MEADTSYVPVVDDKGMVNLGYATPSAVRRLAIATQDLIKSGKPLPPSPFAEWAADRVTGKDRQDLTIFIQGRRGSGKSYTALYLGKRLGEAIAARKGGVWQDYFSLKNAATLEDTEAVLQILNNAGSHQVVMIDDAALAISNRSFQSQQNRNFNALLSVCRTNRWIMILTAPLKRMVDNQTRDMVDVSCTVFKSFHAGGFNVLKINTSEISVKGKEYNHRLEFNKAKVDYWVSLKPDEELTRTYDKQREASTRLLSQRIVSTGSFKSPGKTAAPTQTVAERNDAEYIAKNGDSIKEFIKTNPGISTTKIASHYGLSYLKMSRIVDRIRGV